jgi:hypothetical protein
MSNVFTYPNNAGTNYISDTNEILVGALNRANAFLNGGNDERKPYAIPYAGNNTRMAGLSPRTPENLLREISYNRTFYGVASGSGKDGYPSYYSVYQMPNIFAYFHVIKFGFDTATTNPGNGTLRLGCIRNSSTHTGLPVTVTSTQTHGMGNASFKYTDTYDRQFDFSGFTGGYAALNGNTYYVKVVDGRYLDVYNDAAGTSIVNPAGFGAYNGDGFAVIDQPSNGPYQLVGIRFQDQGNSRYYYYDKDYYSGFGNEVNFDFGANVVGARTQFYVKAGQSNTSSFSSNTPIDHNSVAEWWYDSNFNPVVTLTVNGSGAVYNGSNGYITGATFNPEFSGLMDGGGTSAQPTLYGAECLILPDNLDSDAQSGYNFAISNITQASPAVVTFTNSVRSQSGGQLKPIVGVSGMTQINGKGFYLKSISHNQAQLYLDGNYATPFDTTGYSAYTSGGTIQDFDDNAFESLSWTGGFNGRNIAPSSVNFGPRDVTFLDTNFSQFWPNHITPAKVDLQIIQPTRVTYGQDLTKYANSTGAYGYRVTAKYNNINKSEWKIFDAAIKQFRGQAAPFIVFTTGGADGGTWQFFINDGTTGGQWNNTVRLARRMDPGDALLYFHGFDASEQSVISANDVLFQAHTYRSTFSFNNVAFSGGEFGANIFGEAIIRLTQPVKNTVSASSTTIAPNNFNYFAATLANDTIDYDFHPLGYVSFTVEFDLI